LNNSFCQEDDFEDTYEDGEMTYGRRRRFANPNSNRRGGFPYPNHGREREYPSPNEYRMKNEISFFSVNLDIDSSWIEFMK